MEKVISNEIDDMLAKGIIERPEAAYGSPLVLVKKPDRTCVNFKELNKLTVFDPKPMMSADDTFPKLAGSLYYSTFDFCKGYWQIPMEENSKDRTTFVSSRGLFRFKVMPFGLVNAGSTYNRMVRKLLDGATNLQSYVDDVIGHTKNWDEHIQTLRDFFERVSLKSSKCKIVFGTVNFLGHTLNSNFIGPLQETIVRILEMPRPRTKKQVRSLLGLINFYRRYIPDCATLISPLTDLTRRRAPNRVQWRDKQEAAFTNVKEVLSKEPILKLPDLDKEFILQTDASDVGIGACLLQP